MTTRWTRCPRAASSPSSPVTAQRCSNNTAATNPCGDNGPATSAELDGPRDTVALPGGGFLIADFDDARVREVSSGGTITTVAGDGTNGDSGDNGPATSAELSLPRSISLLPGGGYLIADHGNCKIREVSSTGTISTVAGTGTCGYSGDGGPATSATLDNVTDVAALPGGGFILSDSPDDVIREVSTSGKINIAAGVKDDRGDTGDGGPATSAEINQPRGMAPLANGGYVFAEEGGDQIRMVSPANVITTVAGTGTPGFMGDGGPATAAELTDPEGVSLAPNGGLLIADTGNSRIRLVAGGPPSATISAPQTGGMYAQGADVPTSFSCAEDTFGLGLASCDDSNGTNTSAGGTGKLATVQAGTFTYTVTAVSQEGQRAVTSIKYRVVSPLAASIDVRSAQVRHAKLSITLGCNVTLPSGCRGKLLLLAKTTMHHHSKQVVVAQRRYVLTRHKEAFTLTLTSAGRKLLAAARHGRLRVTLEAEQTGGRTIRRTITLTG